MNEYKIADLQKVKKKLEKTQRFKRNLTCITRKLISYNN